MFIDKDLERNPTSIGNFFISEMVDVYLLKQRNKWIEIFEEEITRAGGMNLTIEDFTKETFTIYSRFFKEYQPIPNDFITDEVKGYLNGTKPLKDIPCKGIFSCGK